MQTMNLTCRVCRGAAAFFLLLTLLLAACTATTPAPTPAPVQPSAVPSPAAPTDPTQGWQTSSPEDQDMDGALLAKIQPDIEANHINIHSFLVIRHGVIVYEKYFAPYRADDAHSQYSVTKSITATLLGIAIDQGKFGRLDQPVLGLFDGMQVANPSPEKDALTVENLLTMTTGLEWNDDYIDTVVVPSKDWPKAVLDRAIVHTPGTVFNYCSGCSHVLSAIVQHAVGMSTLEFAKKNLFGPLGITNFFWAQDPQGVAIGGWGLSMTPRDMAKIGLLTLHKGMWDGKQVVSSAWVERATSLHVKMSPLGYGYQWWIYPRYGAFTALGYAGQSIFIIPADDLVIVTTAGLFNHDEIFRLIDTYVATAVKE